MIRYTIDSKLDPAEVSRRAQAFFGAGGVGLTALDEGSGCSRFIGGDGYVALWLCEADGVTNVELEAREWEHQARQFLEAI